MEKIPQVKNKWNRVTIWIPDKINLSQNSYEDQRMIKAQFTKNYNNYE